MVATTIRMGRPKKQHETKHVRMRKDIAGQLKLIAGQRGLDLSDLMHELFSGIVQSEYVKTIDDLMKQRKSIADDNRKNKH